MTPHEPNRPGRTGCLRRAAARCARALPSAVLPAVGSAALGAEDASPGWAGASFLLPNLLALVMSLTVLVIACKRFRKE